MASVALKEMQSTHKVFSALDCNLHQEEDLKSPQDIVFKPVLLLQQCKFCFCKEDIGDFFFFLFC